MNARSLKFNMTSKSMSFAQDSIPNLDIYLLPFGLGV